MSGKDMQFLENTAPFTQGIPTSKTCLQQKGSSCILSAFCFQVCRSFIYMNYHVLGAAGALGGLWWSVEHRFAAIEGFEL